MYSTFMIVRFQNSPIRLILLGESGINKDCRVYKDRESYVCFFDLKSLNVKVAVM